MKKKSIRSNKLSRFQYILLLGDFLLLAILLCNGWQLWQNYLSAQNTIAGNILSQNPDAFAAKILATSTPAWAWVLEILALAVTIALIVVWFMPKVRNRLPMTTINLAWLSIWLIYFIFLFVLTTVVVNSLMGFT